MIPESIQEFWVMKNDDDTFSVTIETKDMSISYPRARIKFSCNGDIAFITAIATFDSDDNQISSYTLTPQMRQED